jgi:hypothetical protein
MKLYEPSWPRLSIIAQLFAHYHLLTNRISGVGGHAVVKILPTASEDSLSSHSQSRMVFDAQVTEGPNMELVKRRLERREFTPCTQWSIEGGEQ